MGIDPRDLAPWAQAQLAAKLAAQIRSKAEKQAALQAEKENKYHNTPDERNGAEGKKIRFQSKLEARRYDELMLMLKAGIIRDLKLQPQFTLQEAYTTPEGKRVRAIRYQADFSYKKNSYAIGSDGFEKIPSDGWVFVVEDAKSKATKTRVYAMKRKLMLERFGIEIQEIAE